MALAFPAIRDVPQAGVPSWEYDILSQLKEAVEILTGQRDAGAHAVMSGNISTRQANNITMTRVTTSISGAYSQTEILALAQNLQDLASNVVLLQNQVNDLIAKLGA